LNYFVSETYGGNSPDPTRATVDADVHLETDLSVMEEALRHGDSQEISLLGGGFPTKINSRGREIALPHHLAGLMESWHDEYSEELKRHGIFNGLFINYAPRDKRFDNGPPFYEVETDSGLRIVTTFPADMLAGIRDHIRTIAEIPNKNNPLYGDQAQFRSRDAHRYLRKEHGYPVHELKDEQAQDVLTKRYYGNGVDGLRIKFVDIYGNIIGEGDDAVAEKLAETARSENKSVQLSINEHTTDAEAALSLNQGSDGAVLVYPNGRNIDVARKWREGEDSTFTTDNSAYRRFEKPIELESGIVITFPDGTSSEDIRCKLKVAAVI